MYSKVKTSDLKRVELSEQVLKKFVKKVSNGRVSEFAHDMGLPYGLVYNLVNGRINSLSAENYQLVFGEDPPYQPPKRVDGSYFRGMVRLWLFLNDDATEADLNKEFYQGKIFKKVDYRMFSGATKTVDVKLENAMEQKFFDQGFSRSEIKKMIKELIFVDDEERISYKHIRPILNYLEETLEVNPNRVLNQYVGRYESGELTTVSKKVYDYSMKLKERTEKTLSLGSRFEIEKLREKIYGKREGLRLFSEVEEELEFLRNYGDKSPRQYLGRCISNYKTAKLKRIASWRAQQIKDVCHELIDRRPELTLVSLPISQKKMRIKKLLAVLKSNLIARAIKEENGNERLLLTPSYRKEEYKTGKYGLISVDKTALFLGMSKMAFDLLVATHKDIFRSIGIHSKEWYLPYLYLNELKEKKGFDLTKAKYEVLARDYGESRRQMRTSDKASML